MRSPKENHLGAKPWLYPTVCKLQCWKPQAKQPVRQEHNPTHLRNEMTKKCVTDEGARQKPTNKINEEEIGNLPEKEFRVMVVKMIKNVSNRVEAQIRKYKKYLT